MALTKAGMLAAIVAQMDTDGHDSTAIATALQWGSICDALATYIESDISSGSSGGGAWELIDSHVSSSDEASFSFTGLDGDTDLIYKLVYDIRTPNGVTVYYDLRPNGLTTNLETQMMAGTGTSSAISELANHLAISFTNNERSVGEMTIAASAGAMRATAGFDCRASAPIDSVALVYGGIWNDTSTNITSFTIAVSTGNNILQNSRFYLYKLVTS